MEGALTLRTPVSDPDVDVRVQGIVDLADIARTVKLEGVEELTGVVSANAAIRARLSDLDARRYERVAARGNVTAKNVNARASTLPHPVNVEELIVELSPRRVEVRSLRMRLGSSDVHMTGSVDNVLAYLLRGEDLEGRASFTSQRVDLDEWRSDRDLEPIPIPARLDLALEGRVTRLKFADLERADARGGLRLKDQRVTLEDFTLRTLGGRVGLNGFYETTDPARPTFSMKLALDSLDIPGAAAAVQTVRMLAPVSRFARGAFTAEVDLAGALGAGMTPLLDVLTGSGSLQTTTLALEGFPALARLSETLSLPRLANPTFRAIRSYIEIRDGDSTCGLSRSRRAISGWRWPARTAWTRPWTTS